MWNRTEGPGAGGANLSDAQGDKHAMGHPVMTTCEPMLVVRSVEKPEHRTGPYFSAMRFQHVLLLLGLPALLLPACKKDEGGPPPSVRITTPGDGFDLNVPDTLHVEADVSGDDGVDMVSFMISDANGIAIMAPVIVVPGSNPAHLSIDLPVTSEQLTGGEYTLTVRAVSGELSTKAYVHFDIVPAPLRTRQVLVLVRPDPGTVAIHVIDSTNTVSMASQLSMDLAGAVVSSTTQRYMLAGSTQGPLMALAPSAAQTLWEIPNNGGGATWFTALDLCTDGRCYAGTADSRLRGYNTLTGALERTLQIGGGRRVRHSCIVGDRIVTAESDALGAAWMTASYQSMSGVPIAEHPLALKVVGMYLRDDEQVLFFGDQNGMGTVRDHNVQGGGGWNPYQWNAAITAVERVDAGTFIVALDNGSVERFTYPSSGSVPIAQVDGVNDLAYEPVSGLVYAGTGSDVLAINPQTGQVVMSIAIGAPVAYVLPLLNR